MAKSINIDLFRQFSENSTEIYTPGCAGHSLLFENWLINSAKHLAGSRFTGICIPGVNRFDFADLNMNAKMKVFFLSNDFRQAYERGQVEYLPIA